MHTNQDYLQVAQKQKNLWKNIILPSRDIVKLRSGIDQGLGTNGW